MRLKRSLHLKQKSRTLRKQANHKDYTAVSLMKHFIAVSSRRTVMVMWFRGKVTVKRSDKLKVIVRR